jgi:hypothetical protein
LNSRTKSLEDELKKTGIPQQRKVLPGIVVPEIAGIAGRP